MRNLTAVTDDLTGAADSGSYFTDRGRRLTIFTSGDCALTRRGDEIISVNLSSRNTDGGTARDRHFALCSRLRQLPDQIIMKKIGTGFRGNDGFELEGMLTALPEYLCFIIDNAPDLGTFTLYGHQYCEGQILHKSLYANDPIMPPTKSFIPEILSEDTNINIGLVDIDAVKGGNILAKTQQAVSAGCRIIVFDAVTKKDTIDIISALFPVYPRVLWTGSLGIADGLAAYLYGEELPHVLKARDIKSVCFCASAYEMAKKQIRRSQENGLSVTELDIDAVMDGDTAAAASAVSDFLAKNKKGDVMLLPKVVRYSCKPGTSQVIMACMEQCASKICKTAEYDRIVLIGGETSQAIFRALGVDSLELLGKLEPGVAEGILHGGAAEGKEFALKGGSLGSEEALEKMLCRRSRI
ncbi:MAG: four-carbon acid sugar kinase family protein [Clostridia bacterium]|nr:four-carbon acid sugar kinase family protein [Clostridia bacterium]